MINYNIPVATTLELGYLATHNGIVDQTMFKWHTKIENRKVQERTLKTDEVALQIIVLLNPEKE